MRPASGTTQKEGFSVVEPIAERKAALDRSQQASAKQEKQRAAAAKVVNYSVPAKGKRLGGEDGADAAVELQPPLQPGRYPAGQQQGAWGRRTCLRTKYSYTC